MKRYIYDDYGVDVDKTIRAIKNNVVFRAFIYSIMIIFGLIFAGVYSISLLMLALSHPIISLFIITIFVAMIMYIYYKEFLNEC